MLPRARRQAPRAAATRGRRTRAACATPTARSRRRHGPARASARRARRRDGRASPAPTPAARQAAHAALNRGRAAPCAVAAQLGRRPRRRSALDRGRRRAAAPARAGGTCGRPRGHAARRRSHGHVGGRASAAAAPTGRPASRPARRRCRRVASAALPVGLIVWRAGRVRRSRARALQQHRGAGARRPAARGARRSACTCGAVRAEQPRRFQRVRREHRGRPRAGAAAAAAAARGRRRWRSAHRHPAPAGRACDSSGGSAARTASPPPQPQTTVVCASTRRRRAPPGGRAHISSGRTGSNGGGARRADCSRRGRRRRPARRAPPARRRRPCRGAADHGHVAEAALVLRHARRGRCARRAAQPGGGRLGRRRPGCRATRSPAWSRPWPVKQPGLSVSSASVALGPHGGVAEQGAGVGVQARGQVDGQHRRPQRVHGIGWPRPSRPAARGARRCRAGRRWTRSRVAGSAHGRLSMATPAACASREGPRRIGGQARRVGQQADPHLLAGLVQVARGHEAVAAVVARARTRHGTARACGARPAPAAPRPGRRGPSARAAACRASAACSTARDAAASCSGQGPPGGAMRPGLQRGCHVAIVAPLAAEGTRRSRGVAPSGAMAPQRRRSMPSPIVPGASRPAIARPARRPSRRPAPSRWSRGRG